MQLESLNNKKVLLLGYGKEGKATEAFLRQHVPTAEISIADQTQGPDYLKKQDDVDIVIKTPGIPRRLVTRPYTTATNLFFSVVQQPVIGVTGSKGKSTTASLIAAIIRESGRPVRLVGNIGKPALEALQEPFDPKGIYVFELSSYQLEDIEYSPHIAVFTTFFPEHLPYHETLDNYFKAKANIIRFSKPEDFFVFNPDDPRIAGLARDTRAQAVPFPSTLPFSPDGLRLRGQHNELNSRAALSVARLLNIPDDVSSRAIRAFEPLPHRMTNIGTFHGITFYDDAISTAPESTIFAIDTLGNIDTLFLGGEDRGLDFSLLAKKIVEAGIHNLILFPTTGTRIEEALQNIGATDLNILHTSSMEEAVRFAYTYTEPGKICLLSTASPSYTLWKNFEAKGDEFIHWVKQLSSDHAA